jgi:hypothetical protein
MIVEHKYCGYAKAPYGNKLIWGAVAFEENGETNTYRYWGSSRKPIIKKYNSFRSRTKKETLLWKIKEKRKLYSGYTELKGSDIQTMFPDLESQIGMYVLYRKLKIKPAS